MSIPQNIYDLVSDMTNDHLDGWMKLGAKKQLEEIRDYVNEVLREIDIRSHQSIRALDCRELKYEKSS